MGAAPEVGKGELLLGVCCCHFGEMREEMKGNYRGG